MVKEKALIDLSSLSDEQKGNIAVVAIVIVIIIAIALYKGWI